MKNLFLKIFSTRNERFLKEIKKFIPAINEEYKQLKSKSDNEILEDSLYLKEKYMQEVGNNFDGKLDHSLSKKREKFLEKILPKAFALMKEALRRELNIELYDVQLLGGIILNKGGIAEMKTGEGKTYTAILSAYLNALTSQQVHVVTVNQYLAKRDSEKVKPIFKRLGISVGCNVVEEDRFAGKANKKEEYKRDIVYGTANEFGFDYLRDNNVKHYEDKLIKHRFYAIVDEIDSILIDEARTPLIISEAEEMTNDNIALLEKCRAIVCSLEEGKIEKDQLGNIEEKGDFEIDLKAKNVVFTEQGMDKIQELAIQFDIINEDENLFNEKFLKVFNLIQLAANAEYVYRKNKEYLVKQNTIFIIDPMTGRVMEGRKWSDGLHQAIEVKEGANISSKTITSATITLQHYFNNYDKLSGMTGTADTEAKEFYDVYGLETFIVPTNKEIQRLDRSDRIFPTKELRDEAFVELVKEEHSNGRPILIGTASVKDNEYYSELLKKNNIPHEMLNAKNHYREAEIIEKAGQKYAVTLATNMAGRGTDIILGGNYENIIDELRENKLHSNQYIVNKINEINITKKNSYKEVIEKGGLLVIGIGKNDSRRVDNQLRGRAGRQGDKGESVFLVSLDDEIFKPFGIERVKNLALKMSGGEEISGKFFSKQLGKLQEKMEEFNFDGRKSLMDFCKPYDSQTDVIYDLRDSILKEQDIEKISKNVKELFKDFIEIKYDSIFPESFFENIENEIYFNLTNLKNNDVNDSENKIDEDEFFNQEIEKFENKIKHFFEKDFCLRGEHDKEIFEMLKDIFAEYKQKRFLGDLRNYLTLRENVLNLVLNKLDEFESNILQRENGSQVLVNFYKEIYLKALDREWRSHLIDLDYLKQGIGLKGYSGKDPKQLFKKESYELFEKMIGFYKDGIGREILSLTNYFSNYYDGESA